MQLLLLAGYKKFEGQVPWLSDEDGLPLLEQRIRQAMAWHRQPTVVLSGSSADEVLRACRSLEKCEIVFDTHDSPHLLSNLRAGLKTVVGPCLVWPVEIPVSTQEHITSLCSLAMRKGKTVKSHCLQAVGDSGQVINSGFPLIITQSGQKFVLGNLELKTLADPGLIYEFLASRGKDL